MAREGTECDHGSLNILAGSERRGLTDRKDAPPQTPSELVACRIGSPRRENAKPVMRVNHKQPLNDKLTTTGTIWVVSIELCGSDPALDGKCQGS